MSNKSLSNTLKTSSNNRCLMEIVDEGLCLRCGACSGVCPDKVLELDHDGYPLPLDECSGCNRCVAVCPGQKVDFPALGTSLFGSDYEYDQALGPLKAAYIGCATDEDLRWHGASGGAVSQILLDLIESGKIKGAIVTTKDPADPCKGKGIIARTRSEIISAAQSRYTTSPTLEVLRDIESDEGPYAVVGLPCHIHAIRKLQHLDKAWKKRIYATIGLLCSRTPPCSASRELAQLVAPRGTTISSFEYRKKIEGSGWPDNTYELSFSDGSKWRSPYGSPKTVAMLGAFFHTGRCLSCIDATAEFADISVGDPWIRDAEGNWKYSDPRGFSSLITRSQIGENVLEEVAKNKRIQLEQIDPNEIYAGQRTMIGQKKVDAPSRMRVMEILGKSVPEYKLDFPRPKAFTIFKQSIHLLLRRISKLRLIRTMLIKFALSSYGIKIAKSYIALKDKQRSKGQH